MVKDHTKDVAEFQKEAKDGHDQAIKNYAEKTVPVLQTHLDLARKMDASITQSASDRTNNGTTYQKSLCSHALTLSDFPLTRAHRGRPSRNQGRHFFSRLSPRTFL